MLLLVTIDTNVLVHLFNPDFNKDRHIEVLFTHFRALDYRACVDRKVIPKEYQAVVEKWMRNKDQEGNEVILVRHWLDPNNQERIDIDRTGPLYKTVEKVVKKRVKPKDLGDSDWRRDCIFVTVACAGRCKLVTNDSGHILESRQDLLIEIPKVHEAWDSAIDFLSSYAAHSLFCGT